MDKPRNIVAKYAPEFCKPKVFRNRKKEHKKEGWQDGPKHQPYQRERKDWLKGDENVDQS